MSEQEYLISLSEKLSSYLTNDDKKYDSTQMINSIITSIVQYFDCDYLKLIEALESLIHMRNIGEFTKYSDVENRFDISTTKRSLSVKGFLSKGKPILFFYIGDNENPHGIVKTISENGKDIYSVEISNNADVLANYKKDTSNLANSYIIVDEFEYASKECKVTKNVYAETDSTEKGMLKIMDIPDILDEHKNFIILLNNAMSDKGIDLTKISGFGADILFLSFYDEINNMCKDTKILPLKDLVYLINETIYPEKLQPQSTSSDLIDKLQFGETNNDSIEQKKFLFVRNVDGKELRYEVVKSEKYLSIEVFEGDVKICSSMIVSTADGFSFFRSSGNKQASASFSDVPSFVINVSENKMKLMTIESGEIKKGDGRKFEALIVFENNGAIKLASSDSKVSKSKTKPKVTTNAGLGE